MSDETSSQAALASDLSSVKADMVEVKSSLNRIADALTKLAVLEDRQASQTAMIGRALDRIELLEEKQHATELRFASGIYSTERVQSVEKKFDDLNGRLTGYEASGRTIGAGVKIIWAVVGGAVTSAAAFFFTKGG